MNANTIIISPTTEVKIQDVDWQLLDEHIGLQGFLRDAQLNTGISPKTIETYHENRVGQYEKVNKLMQFVRDFHAATTPNTAA